MLRLAMLAFLVILKIGVEVFKGTRLLRSSIAGKPLKRLLDGAIGLSTGMVLGYLLIRRPLPWQLPCVGFVGSFVFNALFPAKWMRGKGRMHQ